ncbi:hypothetical protein BD408DRAFT_407779 [Parasitella parasitica]|nr:hypothetical protein BD408DRAFT_407779 [Parasitella parasitica]
MKQPQSTVIFVQSTAHWEAIQQQRAQILGVTSSPPTTPTTSDLSPPRMVSREPKQASSKKPSRLIGKEGSRRRNRWTNNTFADHPSAVLYAEDLRPPGYEANPPKYDIGLLVANQQDQDQEQATSTHQNVQEKAHNLSRRVRHSLKKTHISKSLITNYESQLIEFIHVWLNDVECLENACLKIHVASNNQFERYVLHLMSRYYGFSSFSKTNDQSQRITYICHPAYLDYVSNDRLSTTAIDYSLLQHWLMPEKSFFEYLFHQVM